jgi:oligoribonuclease NrnB/cAMP/cGMP phosphodiesterase (DHH superfamily)
LNLIYNQIDLISDSNLKPVIEKILVSVVNNTDTYKKEYDKFLEESKNTIKNHFSKYFLHPLLDVLDKPLENLYLAETSTKYQIEMDISDEFFSNFDVNISELLQSFFINKDVNLLSLGLEQMFLDLEEIKSLIKKYFSNIGLSDVYSEILEISKNSRLIDKSELYLYFFEIGI